MFCGLSARGFLKRYERKGRGLNLGSGPRAFPGFCIMNVDIHPYIGVDIVADITSVPLESESIGRVICDNVLEHVSRPDQVVREMHRLLAAGGVAYIATPFLYPFHSSPNDHQRWTVQGLQELFGGFQIVEIGVRAGPFSALTVYLWHVCALLVAVGSMRLYAFLLNVFMFLFLPIKLLDLDVNYWPNAHTIAAMLYCVIRKGA